MARCFWRFGITGQPPTRPRGGVNIQIPGVQAEALTAVDPIFGGQQLLQFTSGQDGITIPNFLLKDYPIFIRLEKPQR